MSRVVERLFLTVPRGCLQFVIVVFPDHTHLLFFIFTENHRHLPIASVNDPFESMDITKALIYQ